VREIDRDSPEAVDWNGTRLSTEVDGRIFVISDAKGVAAWAGEKLTSDRARDIQVATREDARRRGLARKVASHAFNAIVEDGITPFYSHEVGNAPSARLAATLDFRPYGLAVLAEYQIPIDPDHLQNVSPTSEQ
jgi:ribosomal protein S18 acetylase RimI-like enzyme